MRAAYGGCELWDLLQGDVLRERGPSQEEEGDRLERRSAGGVRKGSHNAGQVPVRPDRPLLRRVLHQETHHEGDGVRAVRVADRLRQEAASAG